MADKKILSSGNTGKSFAAKKITSEQGDIVILDINKAIPDSLTERIRISTKKGGLVSLPLGFDNQEGDWKCINSTNPFEILYLDYQQYKCITPEIVKTNLSILESFWREKVAIMNTGGNRVAFKNKYGDGTIENSLSKIKRAFDKISSQDGIEQYFLEINNQRLKKGAESLMESIEDMLVDDIVERAEIELRLERGTKYDLNEDEVLYLIKIAIDKHNLKPYGQVNGNSLKEKLLSVTWMSDVKIEEEKNAEEEIKKRGREIFDNVFAYSTEEIGEILFKNEGLAKEYIRDGLVINSIDYFSSSKAKSIIEISKLQKDEHLKYLQIIYRLNSKLPYKFDNANYPDLKELSKVFFENPKMGKEHLKQGNLEIWLLETQKDNYKKLIEIRDSAENLDLAFLEMLYTFNPEIPYRFAGNHMIKTPTELSSAIDKNKESWEAGREELYNSSILTWLKAIGHTFIVAGWVKIKDNLEKRKDYGLELFLHLLNDKLDLPTLEVSQKNISFPNIQSVTNIKASFILTNKTRGFIEGALSFSKVIEGVTVSPNKINLNSSNGITSTQYTLTINPTNLLKGVDYTTAIQIKSTSNETIIIPVSFKLVFPKNAFIKEIIKYSLFYAIIAGIIRGSWALLGFTDWLNVNYQYYLARLDVTWQRKPEIFYFPLIFFSLLLFLILIIYYRKKIIALLDKI